MRTEKKELKENAELRERIIAVAAKAFRTEGIRSVKMDDIAARLGISKRTLYEVFEDKESLLFDCFRSIRKREHEDIMQIIKTSDNVLDVILNIYQMMMQTLRETNHDILFDLVKYPRILEYIRKKEDENTGNTIEFFQKGVAEGLFRSDVNLKILTLLLSNQRAFLMHSDLCKKFPLGEIYETILYVYMRGMATEKGLKILNDYKEKMKTTK